MSKYYKKFVLNDGRLYSYNVTANSEWGGLCLEYSMEGWNFPIIEGSQLFVNKYEKKEKFSNYGNNQWWEVKIGEEIALENGHVLDICEQGDQNKLVDKINGGWENFPEDINKVRDMFPKTVLTNKLKLIRKV